MKTLIETIQKVLPDVIKEMNEVRIPALESAWGRSFKEEMTNEDQVTVEIAKNYARPLNNTFFRHINKHLSTFLEHNTNGSDYIFDTILIEDKNSFSDSNSWVGNGFQKTPIHLLKKFIVDENGRIVKAFIAIVDLSKCKSAWSEKNLNTNRSTISFAKEDLEHIHVVIGSIKVNTKNLKPILVEIK